MLTSWKPRIKYSRRVNSDTFYREPKNEVKENKRIKNIILPIIFDNEGVIGDFSESHSVECTICRGRICQSEQTDDRLLFTAVCLWVKYTKEYRIIVEYLKAQDT